MLVVGVGRGAADGGPVQQRDSGLQHLADHGFDVGVQMRQDLVRAPVDVVGGRQTVDPLQRRVDGHKPQVGVENGQPDRSLLDQAHRQRRSPLHLPQRGLVGGDAQGVAVPSAVLQPHVAELHHPCVAVLAPDGKTAGPAPAARHDPGEQLDRLLPVLFLEQQPGRVPAPSASWGV
ncbi:hypothetical protein GCM10010405_43100 [Streptomyces macrosporus]|uniref:Uncharacterized protein n=1 Tax=Streptomyces macrosporus TaxID=44032 RepID=A0ABN3KEL5_9ACTN